MEKRIAKPYLFHFIHVPIVILYSLLTGEDGNTIGLIATIVFVISGITYAYNFSGTILILKLFKSQKLRYFSFVTPPILLLLTKIFWEELFDMLDFGNEETIWYLIISIFVINISTYYYLQSNRKKGST